MKQLIVKEKGTHERLDVWLFRYHGIMSRSAYHKEIIKGAVLLNDKKAKPSTVVRQGDVIATMLDERAPDPLRPIKENLNIIYEDNDILIINKPAGLIVHPTANSKIITLVNYLMSYCPSIKGVGESPFRPGIVHRLDKLASGLMVIAKNNESFARLKQAWQKGEVQKKYLTLVWGELHESGSVELNIVRSKRSGKMVTTKVDGREATTLYRPLKRYTTTTLLEVETKTGRTHQIRTHFKAIGHPVVGDPLYKGKKVPTTKGVGIPTDNVGKRNYKTPRLFLHAFYLKFSINNEYKIFKSPLPKDLKKYLDSLKPKT